MTDENGNSGDWNSGDWNSGDYNSGNNNSGGKNSGYYNSGNYNSGDNNTGHRNSGYKNSGGKNSGDNNSGDNNSGHRNSGNFNSGNFNSGDFNSGDENLGDFNSGDENSGDFNINQPKFRLFNKDTEYTKSEFLKKYDYPLFYFNVKLTKWIFESDMTTTEKEEHPEYKTAHGYLKTYSYKEAWRISFDKICDKVAAEKTVNLPNFDYDIFEEITGITKAMLNKKRELNPVKNHDINLDDLSKESLINIIKKLSQ